jgi:Flp pilus assembly protein TadG
MLLARFWKDCRGGAAPMLALAVIPVLGAVGAGVDYARVNAARTAMQSAVDSTALAMSRQAQTMSAAQIQSTAQNYFNSIYVRPEVRDIQLTTVFTNPQQGSFSLSVTGKGTVDMLFARLLGTSAIDFQAKGEVVWGIKKLNLALALDNTGSMSSSGKMTALKQAAHNLLNTLKDAAKQPGDVLVSIVPFAVDVNVDIANKNANWLDWGEWDNVNGSCSRSQYTTKTSCQNAGRTWTTDSHNNWNGCVWDRDQNYDVNSTAPTTSGTKFEPHQADNCPVAMMPLSSDWDALHSKVDDMTPTGNTNVTIGLAHAWQTLAPNSPWNAPSPAPDLDKVIVLLTDGENTQNRWTTSASSIDSRTSKVCDNIKAANIRVYTVRVINGDVTLLKGCATKTDMYYDVSQASQLNGVFSSIAQNLANLRISK